jgi:hypothetical protein
MRGARIEISAEASTALSTSYTVLTLDDDTGGDAGARPVPDRCYLDRIDFELASAGSTTTLTAYVCADTSRDVGLTNPTPITLVAGATANDATGSLYLGTYYRRLSAGTAGKLRVAVKVDAGTPTCIARLTHVEPM